MKCQGWTGGENWNKLCSLGGRVLSFNTGSNIGMRDVRNLLLVEVNLNPVLCRQNRFSGTLRGAGDVKEG